MIPESPEDLDEEELEALQQQMDEDFELATGELVSELVSGWVSGSVVTLCLCLKLGSHFSVHAQWRSRVHVILRIRVCVMRRPGHKPCPQQQHVSTCTHMSTHPLLSLARAFT